MNMRCYYAHCQDIYDTACEAADIAVLHALGFEVVNPNDPEIASQVRAAKLAGAANYMETVFLPIVVGCNVLAFRPLPDGRIPAGVAKEIGWARQAGKLVIELPERIEARTMSVAETRAYLAQVGQR